MLTITRRQAQQLRSVLRRAFGNIRGPGPALGFTADAEGLTVKSMCANVAVEYHVPGTYNPETLWLPHQFLADCEAKNDEPVELAAADSGRVTAKWRDGNVPQLVQYDSSPPHDADKFPPRPDNFVENPPELLEAFTATTDICDPDSARYALGHMQLLGEQGCIVASDGRQLLIQDGFHFPWTGNILVPNSKVFALSTIPHDQPVRVGKTDNWVGISVGNWTIYLAVNTGGRYPDILRCVPQIDATTSRCTFSKTDADFLIQGLPRLPNTDSCNCPVTLDLNGRVVVRGKRADSTQPTEIVLTGSTFSGQPIQVNTNRNYLGRAMRLGLRELYFTDDKAAILGHDATMQYVWMPLDPETAIAPTDDAIRIESPQSEASVSVRSSLKSKTERKTKPMNETTTNTVASPPAANRLAEQPETAATNKKSTRRKSNQRDITKLIDQAIKFRTASHNLRHEAGELVKALKQHHRTSKAIQNALTSISQVKDLI